MRAPLTTRTFCLHTLALAFLATLSTGAYAVDGTVNVTGTVTNTTCTIVGNGVNGVGSFTVALPQVYTGALAVAGDTAGSTPFTIGVTGCTGTSTTMTPYFEAGGSINANGRLSNTSGTAANIDVQITTGGGAVVAMNGALGAQNITATTLSSNAGTSSFVAKYYATGVGGAGTFQSQFNYTIVYN